MKKRGLGRGLDALLGTDPAAADHNGELRQLGVEQLTRGRFQPRVDFAEDRLRELADSIRAQGVVQPILVRPTASGRFEIVAGERRWRAAQIAGLMEVPVLVREYSDRDAMSLALIENIQRQDLNPMEEATALARLVQEFAMTHQEVAEAVGRSRATITNLLRLLDLREDVKHMLERGDLDMGHARALLALEGRAQSETARAVISKGLSVRETERLVKQRQGGETKPPPAPARDPNVLRLEDDLAERLGAPVTIHHTAKGTGSIHIAYHSLEELDGILSRIR
jgi:ParB family chromosome partitioning protein